MAKREVKPVRVEKLVNVLGKTLKVITVNYAPGDKSGEQHHAGSVFAYVLSGDQIRKPRDRTGQGLQGRRELLWAARQLNLCSGIGV